MALGKQVLISSLGAKLKIQKCKLIRDWFFANELADFSDPFTNFLLSKRLPKNFIEDEHIRKKVVDFFSSFDGQIKDFKVKKIPSIEKGSIDNGYTISALHQMVNSDEMAELPLGAESAGTLKMLSLYPELQKVLEKGSLFIIDELNARLHPLLVRNILLTFLDPHINTNHAQLVFTTHDTWLLKNKFFRNDEVWFVEKSDEGLSTLYSRVDFQDSKNAKGMHDEEDLYLAGIYGAIPNLRSLRTIREN